MTQWLYRRVIVWSNVGRNCKKLAEERGLEFDHTSSWDGFSGFPYWLVPCFRSERTKRYVRLNPERDWPESLYEWLAWDEANGHADVAMDVVSRFGLEGWELAGIQLGSIPGMTDPSQWPISYYIFKKPAE